MLLERSAKLSVSDSGQLTGSPSVGIVGSEALKKVVITSVIHGVASEFVSVRHQPDRTNQ